MSELNAVVLYSQELDANLSSRATHLGLVDVRVLELHHAFLSQHSVSLSSLAQRVLAHRVLEQRVLEPAPRVLVRRTPSYLARRVYESTIFGSHRSSDVWSYVSVQWVLQGSLTKSS